MTASLSPNSGVPLYRSKPACDTAEATGHAAGVMFVAPDGDVLLLRRSPTETNFGGHWALPGGGVEGGESAWQGAAREVGEEIGLHAEDQMKPKMLDQRRTPTGKVFHTFAVPVSRKFAPSLNDEHVGYTWSSMNSLPGPMHPAVEQTLRDRVGVGQDMAPEDWSALRDGFTKWTIEEEAEPEHASDHALALDRDSVRQKDIDGRLHVSVANICKACVSPYRGWEIPNYEDLGLDHDKVYNLFRPAEELEKGTPTLNGVQLLRKHIPVSADDHQPWDVVGAIGTTAKFEDPYVRNGLTIWPTADINDVESGAKRQLSPGYKYTAVMEPGTFEGESYDGKMTDIVFNHVAIVETGRQGTDVVVGDAVMDAVMWDRIESEILSLRP